MALSCALTSTGTAGAKQGLQPAPAFSVDAATLLKESRIPKVREGHAIQELLEESLISFDAQGRRETRYRYIFRVDHESGIQGWDSVGAIWAPWHQERPSIRARVITPDGRSHALDPATIGEFPVKDDSPQIYDDRKRLAAPLPQLCLGAVAEVEVVTRETAPVLAVGTLATILLEQPVPVQQTRVVVEAPETLPLTCKLKGLPGVQPVRKLEQGRQRLILELGPLDPPEPREPYADPEARPAAQLHLSTSPSWAVAAKAYGEIVDRQIADADLAAWGKAVIGGAATPRAKIDRLVARMSRDIRFTGLEFGEGSIVPRKPKETLTRGFGDCKDKASLLVALLRQQGIGAQVALLLTGSGADIDPDLPGINHFDHAIVVVPGPSPLWIDPTAEFARAGDLPVQDQGRWALIAGPETTGLVRTPQVESTGNLEIETREVFLAERGKGRVIETATPMGLAEMRLRSELRETEPKKLRESLKQYIKNAYTAEDLGEMAVSDPRDLSRPFTVRLEGLKTEVALTYDLDALVVINPWSLGDRLRQLVPTSTDVKGKEPATARKGDLLFPEPYAIEWRYRLVPPPGFAAQPLPASDVVTFGPASLSRTFLKQPNGEVVATFRMDSGKRRWTAAEVETARGAMEAFGKLPPTRLIFDQVGEAHLAAGRIKEAIHAFRSEAAAQPAKGAPLSRLSLALLKAGLGEEARDVARRASVLEPTSMYVNRILGWVLTHDLVGRQYHKGWDYPGSESAFQKAKSLDPKDELSRKNLALVHEYNLDGERYGRGCHLDLAIKEYLDLRKDLKDETRNVNLLVDLNRAGRYKEGEEFARSLPVSPERSTWLLTAIAAGQGGDAALKEAMIAIPDLDKRRTALLGAADVLIVLRKYPEAAALLNAGAEGASESSSIRARASILARTRKFENLSLDPKAPATILWRLLESAFATQGTNKEFMELFSSGMRATMSSDADPGAFRRGVASSLAGRGTSGEVALDLCYALGQVSVEGDEAKGYRVRIQLPNNNNVQNMVWYVSREKGRNVISGTDFAESTLGTEALRRVDLGDLAGARGFLDWAREQIEPGGGDDPLSGHPFTRFWTRGQEADAETIRAAAASLQVSDKECTGAVPLLRSARAKAMDDSARLRFDAALMTAHAVRSEWVDLEAVTGRLFTAYPSSKKVMSMRCRALSALKRWEEILPILDKQLERTPRDPDLIESKLSALGYLGRDEEGERLSLSMVTSGQATPWTFNHLAWGQLVAGRVTEQTLEFARKSLMLRPDGYPAAQHTLAAVLAERGETAEALELFFKRIGNGMEEKLEGDDWYLLGRIAEQFGESGAALKCYARVSTPEPRENAAKSCFALATRRLAALGKPRVGPSPSFK